MPFVIQNDGNAFLNITINSTALWESVAIPSDYFMFKVDNYTGEEGAFDWKTSNITWSQLPPAAGTALAISMLNFSNATDIAEIDILVEVPVDEPPGNKSTNVILTGSLGE